MKTLLAGAACSFALAAASSVAEAQTTAASGWALDRFEPAPAGDGFLLAEHPRYAPRWGVAMGTTLEHASSPLRVVNTYADGHTASSRVVAAMTVALFSASASFGRRWGVDLVVPLSLAQSGTEALLGTIVVGPAAGPVFGDARLGGRVRVVGRAELDPFSLHVGAWVWLPTGSRKGNTSDGALRAEPRIIFAGSVGVFRWSLTTGLMFRQSFAAQNLAIGDELRFTAAVGLDLLRGRLRVGPEMYVVTPIGSVPASGASAFFASGQWGAEALAGAQVALSRGLFVGGGLGFGLQQGGGTPGARVALTLTWRGPSSDVGSDAFGAE